MKVSATDMLTGVLLCVVLAGTVLLEWGAGAELIAWGTNLALVAALALMTPRVRWGRKAFVIVGLGLTVAALILHDDAYAAIAKATRTAAFVAAFFAALSTLGKAAETSPAIHGCGYYLARQPPARRYLALTVGGQMFSLLLNYGSIQLLGNLAISAVSADPDERVRKIRMRRMLLAIERALVSTLTWSPLTYSVTMVSILVPGASWSAVLLPSLVSGAILAGTGWAMDAFGGPRARAPRRDDLADPGRWTSLMPLLALLLFLGAIVLGLYETAGIRVPGIVIAVVPVISVAWILWQESRRQGAGAAGRIGRFVLSDLPGMGSEIVLLTMAAYIGSIGSFLFLPVAASLAPAVTALPAWLILILLLVIIPLTGQLGMNPLLSVSLLVPLLPSAAEMGTSPAALFMALTGGWALSGISSPFTAMAVILGRFASIPPRAVGLQWNGPYTLVSGVLLAIWVVTCSRIMPV